MGVCLQGPRALNARVDFPKDADTIDRSILIGNLAPVITEEQARLPAGCCCCCCCCCTPAPSQALTHAVPLQLRQLFAFCGTVLSVRFTGTPERFAILEYAASNVRAPPLPAPVLPLPSLL